MKTAVAMTVLAAALTLCWLSSRGTATQPSPPVEQPLEVPAPPPADAEGPDFVGLVTWQPDASGTFELTGLPPCQLRLGRHFGGCLIMENPVVVSIGEPSEYTVEMPSYEGCR